MRFVLGVWILLAACGPQKKPDEAPYKPVLDPERKKQFDDVTFQTHTENVQKVVWFFTALNKFNSADPAEWDEALLELQRPEIRGVQYSVGSVDPKAPPEQSSDLALISQVKGPDAKRAAEARKELGQRAKMFFELAKFHDPFTVERWDTAKRRLFEFGDRGKFQMALVLLNVLLEQRPTDWAHARFYLAELDVFGFEVVKAYLETVLLPRVPERAIGLTAGFAFHKNKLEQCFMALLQMGSPAARQYFLELSKNPKPWVRFCLTTAIVESRDVSRFDVLSRFIADPDEDVRSKTYESLGKMNYARDEAGPVLIRALSTEKEPSCLAYIPQALVALRYRAGVPKLVELLDHPDYPVVSKVMEALEGLTGASQARGKKFQTPAEWKRHWEEKIKPTWK